MQNMWCCKLLLHHQPSPIFDAGTLPCYQEGHLVRDCPTRHAVGDTGGKKPKPGYVCRACGSENHFLDDCPVANQGVSREGGGGRRRDPPKEITSVSSTWLDVIVRLTNHLVCSGRVLVLFIKSSTCVRRQACDEPCCTHAHVENI